MRTGGGGGGSSSSGGISGDVGLSKDIRVNAPKTGYVNPGDVLRKGWDMSRYSERCFMPDAGYSCWKDFDG